MGRALGFQSEASMVHTVLWPIVLPINDKFCYLVIQETSQLRYDNWFKLEYITKHGAILDYLPIADRYNRYFRRVDILCVNKPTQTLFSGHHLPT